MLARVTAHAVCDLAIKKNASNLPYAKKVTQGWHYMKSIDTGGRASPSPHPPTKINLGHMIYGIHGYYTRIHLQETSNS